MNPCPFLHEPCADFGWEILSIFMDDKLHYQHIVPCGDLNRHQLDPGCWCGPAVEDGMVVHNAADGREEYEQGRLLS